MKHICFINSVFGRDDALIVHRQGKSLINAGYRVTCLLRDDLPDEVRYGIEMKSVGSQVNGIKNRLLSNNKVFKPYLKNYEADVFQISEPELLPLGLWLKKQGKTVVYNLREYYPDYYAEKTNNKLLKKFIHFCSECFFGYVSKRIDGVFNCMPEMHDYIEKKLPCKYFADTPNFPFVNKDFSLSYEDYCKRENIISYFGSIYNISCQEEFLAAINEIPNVKYLLAGVFGDDEYKQRVMSQSGWEKVVFKEGFTKEELPGIINCSIMGNVMKDFKKTETPNGSFSIIKIFESMEAAIPVILSKVSLYEEMIEKYHCGICCDPHNVEEIREAVQYLLDHKKEAYEMGQNGRRAVIEEYSWDKVEKDYIDVFNKLTA